MSVEIVRDMLRVRRLLATQPEQWYPIGREVYNDEGEFIGRFDSNARASSVCDLHNVYLSVCNLCVVLIRKKIDAVKMQKEIALDT